jgi:uncharacterized protein (TIGR02145 family)
MKSLLLLLSPLMFLALSCTTDTTGNTTVVPLAPTGLTATVISTTQVTLNWTDNATNETGYKIQRKTGNGNFVDVASTGTDITTHDDLGLTASTSYSYRVYAFNNVGNSIQYSNEVTVTTTGSAVNLPSVTIGTQIWSSKNLDVAHYRNGDPILQVTDPTQWANLTTGAWCWYDNDSATYAATYGRLYNWYAVNDPRGLAPQGWRIPSEGDWNRLVKFIDPSADTTCQGCSQSSTAGGAMKSTTGWNAPNTGATNSSGFAGLPGGYRYVGGAFGSVGVFGVWWSAGEFDTVFAWGRDLYGGSTNVDRDENNKTYGFSVRVVRD